MFIYVIFVCDVIVCVCVCGAWSFFFVYFCFFFSSRRRHTRCREVSWARRCVQETGTNSEISLCFSKKGTDFLKIEIDLSTLREKASILPLIFSKNENVHFIFRSSKLSRALHNSGFPFRNSVNPFSIIYISHVLCVDTLSLIHI
eukprot:TRINITY_DN18859_c0_g1_i1.p2 TRINITY_DN18859_c0_g1~~TRINITY_DN18859_c0_g1_i1.p2  ORF type:complete len:145 (+),score=30.42 TRINITY_DN18859_c0_g1_i1:42-476(+)